MISLIDLFATFMPIHNSSIINEYGSGNRSSNAGHKIRKKVMGIISELHVGGTCAQKEIV